MNKRNFSILLSVFMGSFVITILLYILGTQQYQMYQETRAEMPEDLQIHDLLTQEQRDRLKEISQISKVGLSTDAYSLRQGENVFYALGYDDNYFSMQQNFLQKGSYPKTENEILISDKTATSLHWKIGEKISLQQGERKLNAQLVDPTMGYNERETFVVQGERQFTVTGIYNAQTSLGMQAMYYGVTDADLPYYVHLKISHLTEIYEVKEQLQKLFPEKQWGENQLMLNYELLHFFKIAEDGRPWTRSLSMVLDVLFPTLIVTIAFVLMVKNIFNIWALYKIKELSMYKSIGATKVQIWKLLWKEGLKISIAPMLVGMVLGLSVVRLNSMSMLSTLSEIYPEIEGKSSFQWLIVGCIALILIFTISITIFFPARVVSKIDIMDGIKGNIQHKEYRKKPKKNLWKELQFNNRKLMRSQYVILTAGLSFLGFLIGIEGMNRYNNEMFAPVKTSYNLTVRYSPQELEYPTIFEELKRELPVEKSFLSISKQIYVLQDSLSYSKEFEETGYNSDYSSAYFYPENGMVGGEIIGVEPEFLRSKGFSSQDVVLVNCVQEDFQQKYSEATFLPYLSSQLTELKYRFLESYPNHLLKVNRETSQLWPELGRLENYKIRLICSIDCWRALMEEGKKDYQQHDAQFPRMYYQWQVQVPQEQLSDSEALIREYMQQHLKANEKYQVTSQQKREQAQEISDRGMLLLGLVLFVGVVGLNIANAYSVSRLYTFRRQHEIGTLLSSGMEKTTLRAQLRREMAVKIIVSAVVSVLVSFGILLLIVQGVSYMRPMSYLSTLRYDIWMGVLVLLCAMTYWIFDRSVALLLQRNILELIKSE